MATRSIVTTKIDSKFIATYIHWDGHPNYRLPILHKYYGSKEKAIALCKSGYISDLKESLQESLGTVPIHNSNIAPMEFDNEIELENEAYDLDCQYLYQFFENGWRWKKTN